MSVILHGGEPLLAGPVRLRRVCEELTSAFEGIAELDLRIHTNGLQLSPRYLDLFDEFGVRVGISLDGDRAANDRHRRYADGRSSHPLVLKAVELLRQERYRHLYLGLLCTVDIENDPRAVLDALAELDPPLIDFLLPHATWDDPPPRPDGSPTAYADWLLAVFDHWHERGRPVPVRLFSSVLSTLSGGPSLTESLGLAPTDLVVVETDGQLEQVDSLKSAYEGAAATGFDVFTHAFDEVAAHPGVQARQLGLAGVSETCRQCPVVRSCGGGLYTHRYRSTGPSDAFDNPSVYCADLAALVRGIEARTAAALVAPAVAEPVELVAAQQDLTRTLLALLNVDIAQHGGEQWAAAWELAATIEASEEGARGLNEVLAHPYTRTWLLDAMELVHERLGAVQVTRRMSACLAAAVVRTGLDLPVRVPFSGGRIFLPGLGELRIANAGRTARRSCAPPRTASASGGKAATRPNAASYGRRRPVPAGGRCAGSRHPVRRPVSCSTTSTRTATATPRPPRTRSTTGPQPTWWSGSARHGSSSRRRRPGVRRRWPVVSPPSPRWPARPRGSPPSGGTDTARWGFPRTAVPRNWRSLCCAVSGGPNCGHFGMSRIFTRRTAPGNIGCPGRKKQFRFPGCWPTPMSGWRWGLSTRAVWRAYRRPSMLWKVPPN